MIVLLLLCAVIHETVTFQDQRISRISEDEPSHESPFSETTNTLSKLKVHFRNICFAFTDNGNLSSSMFYVCNGSTAMCQSL